MIIDRDLVEIIVEKYGTKLQDVILIEELSELQKEMTKYIRGKGVLSHMTEEIAHCLISIDVAMYIHGISESDVKKEIDKKREKIKRSEENDKS